MITFLGEVVIKRNGLKLCPENSNFLLESVFFRKSGENKCHVSKVANLNAVELTLKPELLVQA